MDTISIQLRPETLAKLEQIAERAERSRSQYVRRIVEREVSKVTGESRLADLEQIAAAAQEQAMSGPRPSNPHPQDVMADHMRQWSTPEAHRKDKDTE